MSTWPVALKQSCWRSEPLHCELGRLQKLSIYLSNPASATDQAPSTRGHTQLHIDLTFSETW